MQNELYSCYNGKETSEFIDMTKMKGYKMQNKDLFSHIDHTLLTATASWDEIQILCREALEYGTASVCIPPSYCARVHQTFPDLTVCTVIGFPLGYQTTATKVFEAKNAIENGAVEIDMVINLGDVKNNDFDAVYHEICAIREVTQGQILKVIVETCYLTEDEKVKLCQIVTQADADYIKTSTGFGTAGATVEDIVLFKKHVGPNVRIKAAGGIKTKQDMIDLIQAGSDRLGTSSGIKILMQGQENNGY